MDRRTWWVTVPGLDMTEHTQTRGQKACQLVKAHQIPEWFYKQRAWSQDSWIIENETIKHSLMNSTHCKKNTETREFSLSNFCESVERSLSFLYFLMYVYFFFQSSWHFFAPQIYLQILLTKLKITTKVHFIHQVQLVLNSVLQISPPTKQSCPLLLPYVCVYF